MNTENVRLVFDAALWGGRDAGDNSQFWKPATILEVQGSGPRQTATVRFHHDGRTSRGHFTSAMEPDEEWVMRDAA